MPEHVSHGFPYVEPERHDELSAGIKAQPDTTGEHYPHGGLRPGAKVVPAMGGKASKGRTKLSHEVTGGVLGPEWTRRAKTLRRALSGEIASGVGGGVCGIAASLLLKFAAQKTAAAEQAFQAGDYDTHRKLSESARMDILYAREHAAKEAEARRERGDGNDTPWALPPKGGTP